ncbi:MULTISPECIES: oxidoreductase [Sphingobium]|uniref:oxidoreductase n=1 Tax=Sphingobium sp. MI1205 TaxID=407020 RepID=UPI00076FEF61|nr:FAD-dependent oxidoreductase [Sphingobium sp. MI1205]AMK19966.1 NADH:flavin oxidoreductase [Sphingobium sp. MI1205]
MSLTHILTPQRIADVEIRNRVVRAAHATFLGGGVVNDDLIAYHVARGKGGVGLSIIEILAVHWSSPGSINAFLPDIETGYRKLIDAVRPTGMKLFQQLWHGGHNSQPLDGSPPWSSSDLPGLIVGVPAIPMTKAMIDEVVESYAAAACRCVEWGIDGVEVHAAHGYLPQQFFSPALNARTDDYGGTFENRIRFLREVLEGIRSSVPSGYPVGIRVASDAMVGGVGVEDNLELARYCADRQLIDYVNVSLGNYQTAAKMIGAMHEPAGYEMPTSSPITRGVSLPSIVTGRFRTLEEGDQVIRDGDASMISYVRALIADPELVNKTAAGHPDHVRPCIGCNQGCSARLFEPPYRMGCTVNPGVGFEREIGDDRLTPALTSKKILVVGGGPSGMEAARVAAIRGHQVTLAEASPKLGGSVLAAARAPGRQGILDYTTWQEQEIFRLGVSVRLSTYMDADDVRQEPWDAVIVATGSSPRMDGVQNSNPGEPIAGIDLPHVLSSTDAMFANPSRLGQNAVVVDDAGHYEGIAVAEYLASHGLNVHFVTRHLSVGPKVENAWVVEPALQRLAKLRFQAHTRMRAITIDSSTVVIGPIYMPSTDLRKAIPADTVVFVSLNHSNRKLYDNLAGQFPAVLIVGDAQSARQLPVAVREGHMAGATV